MEFTLIYQHSKTMNTNILWLQKFWLLFRFWFTHQFSHFFLLILVGLSFSRLEVLQSSFCPCFAEWRQRPRCLDICPILEQESDSRPHFRQSGLASPTCLNFDSQNTSKREVTLRDPIGCLHCWFIHFRYNSSELLFFITAFFK